MIRSSFNSFALLGALWLCPSCNLIMDTREACADTTPRRVRILVDWSDYDDKEPEGMSVILYTDGSSVPTLISTNELTHVETYLEEGTYHVAVINYSPDEFANLRFVDMHSMSTARLTTCAVTNPWYKPTRATMGVNEQPETFGFAADTYLELREEMFDSVEVVHLTQLAPQVVTQRVELVIHVRGLQYISALRGALSGMASGYYTGAGHPTESATAYLTDDWTLTRSAWDSNVGTLTATLNTFGRPYGHNGQPEEVYVTLEATRSDGETFTLDLPVGHRFERISRTLLRVEVTDSLTVNSPAAQQPGSNTGSGFEADVNQWGDFEDWNFEL